MQTLTTELEAVNVMLECISEAPVASLEDSGFATADEARKVLRSESRAVQRPGFHWNTEKDYPLYPDVNSHIYLPINCLRADEIRYGSWQREVVLRGSRLYDKKNRTYQFPTEVKAHIVFALPWEELPESARQYIQIRAARVFQASHLGSDTQHRFTAEQEMKAHAALMTDETESGDYNMLTGSWSVGSILMGKRVG